MFLCFLGVSAPGGEYALAFRGYFKGAAARAAGELADNPPELSI